MHFAPLPHRSASAPLLNSLCFWSSIVLFSCSLGFHLYTFFMNLDVSWLLYAAGRVADGEVLYLNIYETNPPISVYFNLPAVKLAAVLGFDATAAFYLYLVSIIILSIGLTWYFVPLVFSHYQPIIRQCIIVAIIYAVTVQYFSNLGQREHIAFLFILPYLFLTIARAQVKTVHPLFAFALGSLAGLGMAFKPFFLLVWIYSEAYLIFYARAGAPYRRPEGLAIVLAAIANAGFTFLFFPEYLGMLTLIKRYYSAYNAQILTLLSDRANFIWILAGVLLLLLKLPSEDRPILHLLFIASGAFLLAALLQRKGWHHFLPSYSISCILLAIMFFRFLETSAYAQGKLRRGLKWASLLFIALLTLKGGAKSWSLKRHAEGSNLIPLARVVQEHAAGRPIYFLTAHLAPSFPLVPLAKAQWPYHFQSLWPLPGIYRLEVLGEKSPQVEADRRFVLDTVLADLEKHPPTLILVNERPEKVYFQDLTLDFLAYFNKEPRFTRLFSQYAFLDKVDEFLVYKRR